MALLKKKQNDNAYYCSNCRMIICSEKIPPYCDYCGQAFSNWEDIHIQIYLDKEQANVERA